jgi:predicted XRE-type DNA-binding protein
MYFMSESKQVDLTPGIIAANTPISPEEQAFMKFCNKALKNVMVDHDLTNIKLAELAGVGRSRISNLRTGSLSQRNYIKVIRALPKAARKEYLEKVFDLKF